MKKLISLALTLVLVLIQCGIFLNANDESLNDILSFSERIDIDADFSSDTVIVTLKKEYSSINCEITKDYFPEIADNIDTIEDLTYYDNIDEISLETDYLERFRQMLALHLKETGKDKVVETIEKLDSRANYDIENASPDYIQEINTASTTNDYNNYADNAAAYNLISLPSAWNITQGESDVKVAVIDTGVVSHRDLDANLLPGYDAHDGSMNVSDIVSIQNGETIYENHGTHVAGIIGAVGNNGIDTVGVCPNVKIVPIQWFYAKTYNNAKKSYSYSAHDSDIVKAIQHMNLNNILIANLSMGLNYSAVVEYAINNYRGLLILAAGNKGEELNSQSSAAAFDCENMIYVGNCSSSDTVWYESNYSDKYVDLFAPGVAIYSLVQNNQVLGMIGTSMSAPMVSGVAALIKSYNPNLSALDIKRLILDNVDVKSAYTGKCVTNGRLNAYKALNAAKNLTEVKTNSFVGKTTNDECDDMVVVRQNGGYYELVTYLGTTSGSLQDYRIGNESNNYNIKYYRTLTKIKYYSDDVVLSGDVNGDGYMDVVVVSTERNDSSRLGKRNLCLMLCKGDGLYKEIICKTNNSNDLVTYPSKFFLTDVDGDNRDDFVAMYKNASGKRAILVNKSNGAAFNTTGVSTTTTRTYIDSDPVFTGDINGDGKSDLIVHWSNNGIRQLLTFKAGANCTFDTAGANLSTGNSTAETFKSRYIVADTTGDGCDDFVVLYKSGNNMSLLTYKGQKNGTNFASAVATSTSLPFVDITALRCGKVDGNKVSNNVPYKAYDIICEYATSAAKRGIYAFYGNSDGKFTQGNYVSVNSVSFSTYDTLMRVGDINGDGYTDIFAIWTHKNNRIKNINFIMYASNGASISSSNSVPFYCKWQASTNNPYYSYCF